MPTPSNDKESILVAMYDSYAKTVMRNQCRNALKSQKRRQNREVTGTDSIQYLFDTLVHTDIYPSEHLIIFDDAYICVVTCEKLYQAMVLLPEKELAVIILDFWYGWSDRDIAKYLQVTERTVYNLRQWAFCSIRNYYERNP